MTVFQSSGKAMKLPVSMTDYSENLLLPSKKTKKSCEPPPYSQLWGGWAKFHPLNDIKKYNEYYDDYGYSKSCIDFQLKIETCDQLDLKLMSCTEREKLSTTLRDFRLKTLQMFPFYPTDLVVNYLRDNCYKVVLSGMAETKNAYSFDLFCWLVSKNHLTRRLPKKSNCNCIKVYIYFWSCCNRLCKFCYIH